MGGSAFSSGPEPLNTPRMSPSVYNYMKTRCHVALRDLFDHVASPIDGPAKQSFGDIDILVTGDKAKSGGKPNPKGSMAAIEKVLGAKRVILNKGNANGHMAISWPADLVSDDEGETETNLGLDRLIQVDIRICDSHEQLQWILFKHAHGDIWNLIGTTIRPYGLTVDEIGMYVRIPEVEKADRKRARVLLTREPSEVLKFLGLPEDGYWDRPFDTLEDMYEYVARCRMFWVKPRSEDDSDVDGGTQGSLESRENLKANDRRRMNLRPAFQKWIDEFRPKCREQGRFLEEQTTREVIQEEALEHFKVREIFSKQRDDFIREKIREAVLRDVIKASVPLGPEDDDVDEAARARQNMDRGNLIRALKGIIFEGDQGYGIVPEEPLQDENGFFIVENIRHFIEQNLDNISESIRANNRFKFEKHKHKRSLEEKDTANVNVPPTAQDPIFGKKL
jgi:hypothetical protein